MQDVASKTERKYGREKSKEEEGRDNATSIAEGHDEVDNTRQKRKETADNVEDGRKKARQSERSKQ